MSAESYYRAEAKNRDRERARRVRQRERNKARNLEGHRREARRHAVLWARRGARAALRDLREGE